MTVTYIPILSVRPAEIIALSELPDLSKDGMTPLVLIKPWLGAGPLARALDKVQNGFPSREWFAELDPEYEPSASSETYAEIQRLRDRTDGFSNWIDFVKQLPHAIPVLQLRGIASAADILDQVNNAAALGRGVCIRIERKTIGVEALIDVISERNDVFFTVVIDYGQQDSRLLVNAVPAIKDVNYIRGKIPSAQIVLSSTTFPSGFSSSSQEIYERSFFNIVDGEVGQLIFSDRGSARALEQGGGGIPRPRIDLPSQSHWSFFRSDCVREAHESLEDFRVRRIEAYGAMADAAVNSQDWDANLNIWGTQLIKITQLRSPFGITSPAKATACRINIHLTRQAFYGVDISKDELEEDWVD